MSDECTLMWQVEARDHGRQVREVLQGRLQISRRLIRLAITQNGIRRNGRPAYLSERVSAGDILEIRWGETPSDDVLPEPIPFETLYEDEDVLVVNKPPGMLVHPTKGVAAGTLANGVVYAWRLTGSHRPFRPLNRLDRDTSGLVLIAKNQFAHQRLSRDLRFVEGGRDPVLGADEAERLDGMRRVHREYAALVQGRVVADRGWIDLPIDRDPNHGNRRQVAPAGRRARTRFEVVERVGNAAHLKVRLQTGRTHQIRVHLAELGHPVIGDTLYGEPSPWIERQALHAERLVFDHPRTGKRIQVTAPWFPDMAELWQRLKEIGRISRGS